MVPGYDFLRVGYGQMGLALRNLSSRTVTLKKGTGVAHISPVNNVLPKMAPGIVVKASFVNRHLSAHPCANVKINKKPCGLWHN